jgi:hypothetical protein
MVLTLNLILIGSNSVLLSGILVSCSGLITTVVGTFISVGALLCVNRSVFYILALSTVYRTSERYVVEALERLESVEYFVVGIIGIVSSIVSAILISNTDAIVALADLINDPAFSALARAIISAAIATITCFVSGRIVLRIVRR